MKKRIFSGAQPTGTLHIGNYLGALKNWVALQDEYESFYCIVNLHAVTLPQDPKVLKQKTLDLARIYLAAGIDPDKSTIFIQSDVAEHAELTWVLSCIARMGELERMTQFKDKARIGTFIAKDYQNEIRFAEQVQAELDAGRGVETPKSSDAVNALLGRILLKLTDKVSDLVKSDNKFDQRQFFNSLRSVLSEYDKEIVTRAGVGLFTYPVLMAADILLYQTDLVPIGQDQKQHLELSRDLAERFNRDFGETFVVPDAFIPQVGAKIMSLQEPTKKMSKSDENPAGSIFLLDDPDTITKKIKRAVTDSGTEIRFDPARPAITNLLTIYHLLTGKSADECEAHFEGKGYGQFKSELAEVTVEFLRPFQERVKEYDEEVLKRILRTGAEKARQIAGETLRSVYDNVGLIGFR